MLSTLSDERALHLLPPLRLLPGPPAAYLDIPASADDGSSSFGQACFGGATSAPGSGAGAGPSAGPGGKAAGRRQELELYVRLMTEGALERCLPASSCSSSSTAGNSSGSAGSREGNGGCWADCSVAVPLVLHRLARACFPDAAAAEPAGEQSQVQAQQCALLCSILHRCTPSSTSSGSSSGGSLGLRHLLGMLLRWDAVAMQPSDAISRERLQALEVACSAAGLDVAAVLSALEA